MKSIRVPFVAGLKEGGPARAMETLLLRGQRFDVNEVNWPGAYPYAPLCAGFIARDDKVLAVSFHVSGLDLRAVNMEDNMHQWEDSTVEFFVQDPSGEAYYNFEMNCIGTILSAAGAGRSNRTVRPAVSSVERYSTLPAERVETEGGVHSWSVVELIPYELIGVDPENVPDALMANFYKCGDLTAHPHFLSWNRIDTPEPDFHRPEFFGKLILG